MTKPRQHTFTTRLAFTFGLLTICGLVACEHNKWWRGSQPYPRSFVEQVSTVEGQQRELKQRMAPAAVEGQSKEQALAKSEGCMSCHGQMDEPDMHPGRPLPIGCVDCHGGDASVHSTLAQPGRPGKPGTPIRDEAYLAAMQDAHVAPRNPEAWYGQHHLQHDRDLGEHAHNDPTLMHGSANPELSYALLNHESPEFVRFINPGDMRVADFSCGACHVTEVAAMKNSMMGHGSQLWAAALYNNGAVPYKTARHGESYSPFGLPQRLQGVIELDTAKWDEGEGMVKSIVRWPSEKEVREQGVLAYLNPLPVWNVTQPGNVLRVFERGNKLPVPGGPLPNPNPADIGNPNPLVEGGRPDKGLSPRGLGTLNRTDPVFLGLQKTRLLDPTLAFLGTNDHPGDFRSSGCTACHTPYANDRDPFHSGQFAQFGHAGDYHGDDPTIPRNQSGHPIKHVMTNAVPTSQCITCHIHPGTSFANSYMGYTWWDNESDGEHMYPATSMEPSEIEAWRSLRRNPEAAHLKGLWGNLHPNAVSHAGDKAPTDFLQQTGQPHADTPDPLVAHAQATDQSDSLDEDTSLTPSSSDAPRDATFNDKLEHNQFADFHGHGWVFRAVFKKDRTGQLVTAGGEPIDPTDPDRWQKAVHLRDIHLEKGMSCVDCHFTQDVHGDGKLYGEVRNAIEITCIDCHGTYDAPATLRTSGPAAPPGGTNLALQRIGPRNQPRFYREDGKIFQRSAINPSVVWEVTQTVDTINPDSEWSKENPHSAQQSRYAKTIRKDNKTWGSIPDPKSPNQKSPNHTSTNPADHLAHSADEMECYTCHTSWMTSCFGCHLPMKANERTPMLHNENLYTRNYTQYNFQVLRDEVFMLGRDGVYKSGEVDEQGRVVKPGKIVPVRSSSAVIVSSQNQNREWVYHQQQTVSGEGYAGQAFNPHFPHAVSAAGTTKQCTDCHISQNNDNNAWMAQLLLQGTNFVNFIGRYAYVATGKGGLEAVAVTEHNEPQAVYGSHLHHLAYPDEYKAFVDDGRTLDEAYHHSAGAAGDLALDHKILDLQQRGEYLYTARGPGGFYAYDIANIDNKGFSERIVSAPVSPLGQRLGFDTKNAVAIASPSTLANDPARQRFSTDPTKPAAGILDPRHPWHPNLEQAMHPVYAYLFVGDAEEGIILTNAATLLDGDPENNFLVRAQLSNGKTAFNPNGVLTGLTHLTMAGHLAYVTAPTGLHIIDFDKPLAPRIIASVPSQTSGGGLNQPRAVAVQFRYAFVTDADGFKTIDITDPAAPRLVEGATTRLADAHRIYLARTYAFVAGGREGLAIIDVTQPDQPKLLQKYKADGKLTDTRDVKVGMTNASLYAYIADADLGLAVVQLMGPNTTYQFRGFAPPLAPQLIATHKTHHPALAISKGLDRDRAVDETGNQTAVFGRLGARPLNLEEMRRLYKKDGKAWYVTDEPVTEPHKYPE